MNAASRHVAAVGLALAVALAAASCSSGDIRGLNPACTPPPKTAAISCDEAVLVAQAVAVSHHVVTRGSKAEVKPEAVAEGRLVPAWWVTFAHVEYRPPSGLRCAPRSYAVVIDAATGQLLAYDDPSPDC
jgi:hypothetical protein